jgi:hypothetical protein
VKNVKKLVIALVCVGLLVALIIPTIYSASKWGTYTLTLTEDVKVVLEHCKASRRCISSGYISDLRLWLSDKFGEYGELSYDGEGIVLSENKEGKITMEFFFFDKKGKKVVLKVEGGELAEGGWLSPIFTIKFNNDYAEITPATKGKKKILWGPGNVNITVECVLKE